MEAQLSYLLSVWLVARFVSIANIPATHISYSLCPAQSSLNKRAREAAKTLAAPYQLTSSEKAVSTQRGAFPLERKEGSVQHTCRPPHYRGSKPTFWGERAAVSSPQEFVSLSLSPFLSL